MTTTNTTTKTPAIDATINNGTVLTLSFANGERLHIDAAQLSAEIRLAATMHGLKQKLVDAAAIPRDTTTGRAATIETKFLAVKEVYDRLLDGEWNKRREGGAAGATGGLLFAALVRLYAGRKTEADIRAYLDGLSDAEQAAIRGSSRVAPVIAEIKAEREAKKAQAGGTVDTDALLAGLDE
jgi:hypothetical protein